MIAFCMKKPRGLFLFLCLWFVLVAGEGCAQTEQDTTLVSEPVVKSPTGAMIRSAFCPGWGQWYNQQYFKAILVFGVEAGLVVNSIYLNQKAVKSQTLSEQEFYQSNRSLSLWWLFGVYLLNILDAYVDAHLWNFDTSPDLSVRGGRDERGIVTIYISCAF
jgi:hypothetical protein